jgi:hypothetical protein
MLSQAGDGSNEAMHLLASKLDRKVFISVPAGVDPGKVSPSAAKDIVKDNIARVAKIGIEERLLPVGQHCIGALCQSVVNAMTSAKTEICPEQFLSKTMAGWVADGVISHPGPGVGALLVMLEKAANHPSNAGRTIFDEGTVGSSPRPSPSSATTSRR